MYKIDIIRSAHELNGVIPEWREFLANFQDRDFRQDPDNIAFSAKCRDMDDCLRIFIIRDGSGIAAIAPFMLEKMIQHLRLGIVNLAPFCIRRLSLFGNQVMVRPGCSHDQILSVLFTALESFDNVFDAIYIEGLMTEGPLYGFLKNISVRQPLFVAFNAHGKAGTCWSVALNGTFPDYIANLKKDTRKKLRKDMKKMDPDGEGTSEIVKIRTAEQVKRFLGDLDQIFKSCWQAKTFGYRRRDTEPDILYYENIAHKGWLRSYILKSNGIPISYELGIQYGNTYYAEEAGYDLKWAKSNPGTFLQYHVIEDLFGSDTPRILDFGYGDAAYKKIYSNNRAQAVYMYIVKRKTVLRYIFSIQDALNVAYGYFHKIAVSIGADRHVRNLLKKRYDKTDVMS